MDELSIDEGLKSLAPPLTSAERRELKQSILADGCLSPITDRTFNYTADLNSPFRSPFSCST